MNKQSAESKVNNVQYCNQAAKKAWKIVRQQDLMIGDDTEILATTVRGHSPILASTSVLSANCCRKQASHS